MLVLVLGLIRPGCVAFSGAGVAALGIFLVGVGRLLGGDAVAFVGGRALLRDLAW